MAELASAYDYARHAGVDVWQFALEMEDLMVLGLAKSDLRYLAVCGYVDHAREVTTRRDDARRFQRCRTLALPERTCFVLTGAGNAAYQEIQGTGVAVPRVLRADGEKSAVDGLLPRWDRSWRTLHVGGQIVKQFCEPAPNQEGVLNAFQEESWARRIDDPLPPNADQDSRFRLHYTIQRLNSHQKRRLVRFRGDGTGQGICWELTEAARVGVLATAIPKHPRRAR